MSNEFEKTKSLLLLSGGHNSSLHALWLSCHEVEIDGLHFRDTSTAGNIAFEAAQEDATRCGGTFHVFDMSPLRGFLGSSQNKPLFDLPYLDEGTDPTDLILMLGLAAKFARNHGYGTIYMGIPSGDENQVKRFMELWEQLSSAFEPTDPQYGHYVHPTLQFVTFPPDELAPQQAVEAPSRAA
jgi:7-cyano-7-deazaguanine synthase in queuosine biosynthesis